MAQEVKIMAEELCKIKEPKINILEGGYSANAPFTFNTWMRDIDMLVQDQSLNNLEAIHLVKDHTKDQV